MPVRISAAFQLYIDPVECIDCGACVPVCPVSAIFALDNLPEKWNQYTELNESYVKAGKFSPKSTPSTKSSSPWLILPSHTSFESIRSPARAASRIEVIPSFSDLTWQRSDPGGASTWSTPHPQACKIHSHPFTAT
ncbi:MAG: ferredoxin family protein [Candidatus Sulfotelmatobacter sp.]